MRLSTECLRSGSRSGTRYVARWMATARDGNASSTVVDYTKRRETVENSEPSKFYPRYGLVKREGYTTIRVPEFLKKYESVGKPVEGNEATSVAATGSAEHVVVEGRIVGMRKVSRSLFFLDIVQDDVRVQVVVGRKSIEENLAAKGESVGQTEQVGSAGQTGELDSESSSFEWHASLRKGDHISVAGYPNRTKAGELSLRATSAVKMVSPCLRQPAHRLEHRDKINSQRVLNYLVNPMQRQTLVVKAAVIAAIRGYLSTRGFLEVQTPIVAGAGTGANAEPFLTTSKAIDSSSSGALQLRVAPELWLKKLVISGFDKVFEIGQNFRNEGIDATHNPEFLSCEFYKSHTDLDELMKITEEIFAEILARLPASQRQLPQEDKTLFDQLRSGSYARYEFIPTLESKIGLSFPAQLTSESLIEYFHQAGIKVPDQRSPSNLLDTLSGLYLEPLSHEGPIFIYNQPAVMSPLAKSAPIEYHGNTYNVSLRFEMFIRGKEYVNSYEEENSPFEQLSKFEAQVAAKDEFHDNESLVPDWEYVKAMEYGLPPTGGWGCGIDRLAMLFSGSERIEDVLPFGSLKDVIKQ
ncbi:lysine--tRNA ligase, mitochondrial [[Candida] anglica]|uniref:Lysine--tRNA ligase, mitochondrial n=1 Tax=[Candida] anglica TaxID=148631 RepID=A0ABP0E9F3_9ASCO